MDMHRRTTNVDLNLGEMMGAYQRHQDATLRLVQELIKNSSPAQLVGWMAKQMNELERLHALAYAARQGRLVDVYLDGADRRYEARKFLRGLSLGLSGRRDADRASAGALEEMSRLGAEFEQMSERQLITALASRIRLLQELAGSEEEGTELALALLESVLPTHAYQRILRLAANTERQTDE